MAKRLIWSVRAKKELLETLNYWDERNLSPAYSKKLVSRINSITAAISEQPFLGRATTVTNVRVTGFDAYLIFYEIFPKHVLILSVFDGRQDPEKHIVP